jgi:hypothetical protein
MNSSLTIHYVDKMTYERLNRMAERRGLTAEATAMELIRTALSSEQEEPLIMPQSQLDLLAGTWSEAEATSFLQAIADFSQIDEELWQ